VKKLLLVAVVLVVLLVVADFVARSYVERKVETSAASELDGVGSVEAEVGSFPFLPRLALGGEVSKFTLHMEDVVDQDVELAELTIDLEGIELDRDSLFGDSRVQITGVDQATVSAVIDDAFLDRFAERLGVDVDVRLVPGGVEVSALGRTVSADVAIEGRELVVDAAGLVSLRFPLPSTDVVPCDFSAEILDGRVEVTCTSDELPPRLVDAIGSIELRG
jgi:hypothetical protein